MRINVCAFLAVIWLLTGSVFAQQQPEDPRISSARQFFEEYINLEHTFDPAVADFYTDDALIQDTRIYPTGQKRMLTLPAAKYKTLLRQSAPLAKVRGDTSEYSDITYVIEKEKVRINAMRHSNLKNYDSPISILIDRDHDEQWKIVEEISESQP